MCVCVPAVAARDAGSAGRGLGRGSWRTACNFSLIYRKSAGDEFRLCVIARIASGNIQLIVTPTVGRCLLSKCGCDYTYVSIVARQSTVVGVAFN